MPKNICRWGFLSTAAIGRKNWKAVRLSGNATVTAVASRTTLAAQQFIQECMDEVPMSPERPVAVEGYEALLQRDDVDAVYIPLPTAMRARWVRQAAASGKHVLCEKPVAIDHAQALDMVQACREHGVQFMDGVMFNHSRRLEAMKADLTGAGGIGSLRRAYAAFTFNGGDDFNRSNIRTDSRLEPHGCLGDLGWYSIRILLWAFGYQLPVAVTARSLRGLQGEHSPAPVPGEFSAELFFPGGATAALYNSFVTENQQIAIFSGDRGYVQLDDFVLPFYSPERSWTCNQNVLEVDNCRWNMRQHANRKAINEYPSGEANAQEVNMIRTFSQLVNEQCLDDFWPEITLKTQRVLDACYASAQQAGKQIAL